VKRLFGRKSVRIIGQHPTWGVTILIFCTKFLALDPARRLAVSA
jgi:hypothetical protein